MKYFKTEASRKAERFIISAKSFTEHTKHQFPYEQRGITQQYSQYGLCPSCLNPIQLIGISHKTKVTPHGKHTGKRVEGLADWNQPKYAYCPFASHSSYVTPNEEDLLPDIDQGTIELYDLLREQFDRAVYVIQKAFHIQCSPNFWKKTLRTFTANRIYCYPWLTESNLPYILALRGIHLNRCVGQCFEIDSDIHHALSNYSGVVWQKCNYKNYERLWHQENVFLNLIFRLTNHKQKAMEGKVLKETLDFCIDDKRTRQTVFQDTIEFDETYFMNLVRANRGFRNQTLLQIATDEMPPLQPTV